MNSEITVQSLSTVMPTLNHECRYLVIHLLLGILSLALVAC